MMFATVFFFALLIIFLSLDDHSFVRSKMRRTNTLRTLAPNFFCASMGFKPQEAGEPARGDRATQRSAIRALMAGFAIATIRGCQEFRQPARRETLSDETHDAIN